MPDRSRRRPYAKSTIPRRVATGLRVFGGLALMAFNLIAVWWARERIPAAALFIAQVAAALAGLWPVATILSDCTNPQSREIQESRLGNGDWIRWTTIGLLSIIVLTSGLTFGPLVRFAADVTHTTPPVTPTLQTLTTSLPALLVAAVLAAILWQLRRWSISVAVSQRVKHEMWDSEKGLARVAETLRSVIEVTILERIVAWIKHTVTNSARIVWIVEHGVLEGIIDRAVQAVMNSATVAYRAIEQEGLEGVLRRTVSAALALGRRMQRWHTGRLRRNLLWVPVALALAIITLVIAGGNL
jgi:hypothetical protein